MRKVCTHLTRRGRLCRNPAAAGTNPPACYRHRGRPAPAMLPLSPPAPAMPATRHFYFPRPTGEVQATEASDLGADLGPEIALVRVVLRRLMAYLDESAGELPADDVRRLAGLVFTGARTVAHLLGQRSAAPDELRHWLDNAMAAIADERREES